MNEEQLLNILAVMVVLLSLFTVVGTAYILRSILLQIQMRNFSQEERLKKYIESKFDIKWPLCFIGVFVLGVFVAKLKLNLQVANLNLIFFVLFSLLLWGNINTLRVRKKILERLKSKRQSPNEPS